MTVLLAWFSARPQESRWISAARERVDAALAGLVGDAAERHQAWAGDHGLTVVHEADHGPAWPPCAVGGDLTAVSVGLPIGLDVAGGPLSLARRLLGGEDTHVAVVPPFALLSVEAGRRAVLQQDWLGQARLFTATRDEITVVSTRPSLIATFLGETARPDLAGWSSYALTGHFGADFTPVRGVRMLAPGERLTARRRDGGGWDVATERRRAIDDVVLEGLAVRPRGLQAIIDLAIDGLTAAVSTIPRLGDRFRMGLSGGKDSRALAAAFLGTGWLPRLGTNEDLAAEGTTARTLIGILTSSGRVRGVDHGVVRQGSPDKVLAVGLRERVRRLQHLYDYQYPSTYVVRSVPVDRLYVGSRVVSVTGAGGELTTGYWYAPEGMADDTDVDAAVVAGLGQLYRGVDETEVTEAVSAQERTRALPIFDHATELGLRGMELTDYVYLVERVRHWYTTAASVDRAVTPFLAPTAVAASFALTPEQKRRRVIHNALLDRFAPEWADVPFITGGGRGTGTRIWEGDGLDVLAELVDTSGGETARLLRPHAVRRAILHTARGHRTARQERLLQHFAWLAMASQSLEPETVKRSSRLAAEVGRLQAGSATRPPPSGPAVPVWISMLVLPLRPLKRLRPMRRLWEGVRERVSAAMVSRTRSRDR